MSEILFISDLDGTLLNSGAELSERTISVVNRLAADGMLFTYATARSFVTAMKVTQELELSIPVITYNGAFLVNPAGGEIIESCVLKKNEIKPIMDSIENMRLTPMVYSSIDGTEKVSWIAGEENSGIRNYLNVRKGDRRLRAVNGYRQLFDGEIFNIILIGTQDEINEISNVFVGNKYIDWHIQEDTYNKGEYWLEASRYDATKASAVQKMRKRYPSAKIICFGDNINDISMFKAADECYAVANATPELKELATGILESNNNDGVAKFIEKYLNI